MTTFGEYANQVYLACTPAMAAEYLDAHASAPRVRHWDADLLNRKMVEFGFGLLIVAPKFHPVIEAIPPRERKPSTPLHR